MTFSDLTLARRLERAEGHACAQFAEARRRLAPDCGAEWMEIAGAHAVFNGVDSPVTQSFGLGLSAELTDGSLDKIESFFLARGAAVCHEVSPLAGVNALRLLCRRHYLPMELSTVLYRPVEASVARPETNIKVRVAGESEAQLWSQINARGWSHDHPELLQFLTEAGAVLTTRGNTVSFLAEVDGVAGAVGSLCMHEGVALFAGAATVPELRCRGLQAALLEERMRYALEHGCDLAMMVSEVGSESQRNAERKGFGIAYTRVKWALTPQVTP